MADRATALTMRLMKRLWRLVRRIMFAGLLLILASIALLGWIPPPATWLMVSEWRRLGALEQDWVPLTAMAPALPLAAIAAEDANFCRHTGFDIEGIQAALADPSRLRGGSTISQQVAKNVFLWPERSWLRKGLEAGLTVLIELLWPKRRIIEVYLNVAEFGEGIFGVEAAARRHFGIGAEAVTIKQAGRLMAVLPDPKGRSPVSGTAFIQHRGDAIVQGAETVQADGRATCIL